MRARHVMSFTVLAIVAGFTGQSALALEAPQIIGSWRLPGENCATPYLKIAAPAAASDDAVGAIMTREGTVVNGKIVLAGARRGQFVAESSNNLVLFGIDPQRDKLNVFPLAQQYLAWGDVNLEKCP